MEKVKFEFLKQYKDGDASIEVLTREENKNGTYLTVAFFYNDGKDEEDTTFITKVKNDDSEKEFIEIKSIAGKKFKFFAE